MRFIALFLSLVLSVPVQATSLPFRKVDGTAFPGEAYRTNYLKNGEFDQSIKFGISDASSIASLSGSLFGASSLKISSTGSAQIVKVLGYQTDQKISGLTCVATFYYRNGTSEKAYVLDSSTKVSADYTLAVASGTSQRADIYFSCDPSQHTYDLAFESTASGSSLYVDSAFLGEANLISAAVNTGWASFDASVIGSQGFGTLAANTCFWKRASNNMLLDCKITAGTVAASEARVTLPASATIDATNVPSLRLAKGYWVRSNTSGTTIKRGDVLMNGGNTYINFSVDDYTGTANPLVAQNGNTIFSSSDVISIFAEIPISGWISLDAVNPSQSASNWSGYHDNTCSWARTSTSYGDPTADASCVLDQRAAANFGTPTTYNSAGSALPGVVFTPSGNLYWVCATPKIAGATLAATLDVRLWDGTTTIAEGQAQAFVANDIESLPLCGIYTATPGVSTTLSLQTKATSGAVTIAAGSTNASAVEWQIVNLTYGMPNPLLIGYVGNGSGSGISTRFKIQFGGADSVTTCSSGTCSNYLNTGPSATTIVYNGSGIYTLTVPSGTCSSVLGCNVISGSAPAVALTGTANTSTTCKWNCLSSAFANATCYGTVDVECTK